MACLLASRSVLFLRRRFSRLSLCALVLASTLGVRSARAQEPAPDSPMYTMKVETNLVQIPVLVLTRDRQRIAGAIDPSLFSIRLGEGRWTHPKFVRREAEDPIDLALLIDLRAPQRYLLPRLAQAVSELATSSLNSRDRVSIYAMGCSSLHAVEGVPIDEARLRVAIDMVLRAEKNSVNLSCKIGNNLWDDLAYVVHVLSDQPGRRTILAVTDGDDQNSRYTPQALTEFAQVNGVSVFGLDPVLHSGLDMAQVNGGAQIWGRLSGGQQPSSGQLQPMALSTSELQLTDMTESSGGLTLNLGDQNVSQMLKLFVQMLRDRYIVQFRRPDDAGPGKLDFRVRVNGPNFFVRVAGKGVPVANPKDEDRAVHSAAVEEPAPLATTPAMQQPTNLSVDPAKVPNTPQEKH